MASDWHSLYPFESHWMGLDGLRCHYLDEGTGPVLGILEVPYAEEQVPFPAGSLILAYSDGVTEAADAREEEYGMERLEALVGASEAGAAEALRLAVLEDVHAFTDGAPQQDDVTLVVVRRL